ncbi:hypothetical protein KC660_01015 [Candidatus Dojkabacteria bacterium]|uniref:Uncharacterized protein n=1 Tax=Candidatus Dojkabacteria bacterium TaxID=2099670 RepID=A0A955L329_9BACT|nr:hypothetical protein [Candidatus Dojkabacteria bacterium]
MNGKQVATIVLLVIFFFGIPAIIITSIVNYASLNPSADGINGISTQTLQEAVFKNSDIYYILAIIFLVAFVLIVYLFLKSRAQNSKSTPKKSNEPKTKDK